MGIKNIESGLISHITIEKWMAENLLGMRLGPEQRIVKVERLFDELNPRRSDDGRHTPVEYLLSCGCELIVKIDSIPVQIGMISLHQEVDIPNTNLRVKLGMNYNISPWDLNSVILVPCGDLYTGVLENKY